MKQLLIIEPNLPTSRHGLRYTIYMSSFSPHGNLVNNPYLIDEKTESLRSLAGLKSTGTTEI